MRPVLQYQPLAEPALASYSATGNQSFFLTSATATGSNHHRLQVGGVAPADATTSTGWTVGTVAVGLVSKMERGAERAAATFLAPVNDTPDNTLGDCFRTETRLRGTFAAGVWQLSVPLIAVTSGGDQDVSLVVRVRKISDETTGAGLIVSGGSTDVLNLTTAAAQIATFTFSPGALVFDNEHLFIQVACECRNPSGGGAVATRDVLIRVGQDAKLIAPDFTSEVDASEGESPRFAAQLVRRRYIAVGY
jgi:hypothetical protein